MEDQLRKSAQGPAKLLGFDVSHVQEQSAAVLATQPALRGDLLPVWETWRAVKGQRANWWAEVSIVELLAYLDEEGVRDYRERRRHRDAVRVLDAEMMRLIAADQEAARNRAR